MRGPGPTTYAKLVTIFALTISGMCPSTIKIEDEAPRKPVTKVSIIWAVSVHTSPIMATM